MKRTAVVLALVVGLLAGCGDKVLCADGTKQPNEGRQTCLNHGGVKYNAR